MSAIMSVYNNNIKNFTKTYDCTRNFRLSLFDYNTIKFENILLQNYNLTSQ